MSLKKKLFIGCTGFLIMILVISAFSYVQIQKINHSYNQLINNQIKIKSEAKDLVVNFEYSALYLRSYLFTKSSSYKEKYQTAFTAAEQNLKSLHNLVTDKKESQKINSLDKALRDFSIYANEGMQVMNDGPEAVSDFTLHKKGTINGLITMANEVVNEQEKLTNQQIITNKQSVEKIRSLLLCCIFLAIILGIILTLILANKLTKPIVQLKEEVGIVAKGDLTGKELKITTSDEIGSLTASFNLMKQELQKMVKKLSSSSVNVLKSSETLSTTVQQIAAGTEEVASTMNQIAVTVDTVADHTKELSLASEEAATLADNGKQGLNKIEEHMSHIISVSGEVSEAINNLNDSSKEITQIVDMITEVAEQTNLLALNAAIEAARAGEQGRGFAVVAEEVRKLAESSAQSTKQIYDMITNIKNESEHAVSVMKNNLVEIDKSKQVVSMVGINFKEIIDKVYNLAVKIQSVAEAANEISNQVQEVSSVTQEHAASNDRIANLSMELNQMAEDLNQITSEFKIC